MSVMKTNNAFNVFFFHADLINQQRHCSAEYLPFAKFPGDGMWGVWVIVVRGQSIGDDTGVGWSRLGESMLGLCYLRQYSA